MSRWLKKEADSYRRKLASLRNVRAYGGRDDRGREVESRYPMFNDKGEANAYDRKDLFRNQDKFSQLRDKYPARYLRPEKTAATYSQDDQRRIVEHALASPENWRKFGQDMVPLILRELDYEGYGRNIMYTHTVTPGKIVKYEKDIDVTSMVIADDSFAIESRIKGDRIFPPDIGVAALPKISLKEIAIRDYDIVDRTLDKATFQTMLQEDRNILRLLYQGATVDNTAITISGNTNKTVIESLTKMVERWGLVIDKLIMNRTEFGELRTSMNSMDYDPLTSREAWLTGIFTNFWGYKVMVVAGRTTTRLSVPEGLIFAVTAPRFIGGMGIRSDLQAYPADQYVLGDPSRGYLFYELITQALVNSRSVAIANKSTVSIPDWMQA